MPLALPDGGANEGGSNPVIIANPPGAPPVYGNPWDSPSYTAPNPIITGLPVYTPPPVFTSGSLPVLDPNGPETMAWAAANPGTLSFGYIPPNPFTASGGGGASGGAGSSLGPALTDSQFRDLILNDPRYKQMMETLDEDKRIADERAAQELAWFKEEYERRKKSIGSGGGGGNAGLAQMEALDKLQKEKAAHEKALAEKAIKEQMAARGMASSGQGAFEQGELQYEYETLLKEIDLQAAARRASLAASNAAAARSRASSLADLEASYQQGITKAGWDVQDRNRLYAQEKGKILTTVGTYVWNEHAGLYVNGAGQSMLPSQAAGVIASMGAGG
jgi:hypothetical protein